MRSSGSGMSPTMRRAADLALGAAAAAFLALLVAPWRQAPLPGAVDGADPQPAARVSAQPESGTDVPPEAVLRLFTGGVPATTAASAPGLPAAAPVAAPWLRYMGRSSDPDGTSHVYVKDTKSGKVIRATRGQVLNGWILVAEDAEGLTLRFGDDLYAVSTR
jgi:hypothetical protein